MQVADGMVGAVQGVLHVADHGVGPLEHHLVVIPAILVGDDRFVPTLVVGDGGKAAQPVGDHMAPGLDKPGAPGGDLVPGEAAEMAQFQVQGVPFACERQGGDQGVLAGGGPPSFAVAPLAAPVGIVDEQQAPQDQLVILVFHDLLQFVLESQGGFGRNPDGPGQIERGDAVLGLGDQVDGQHPDGQGPLGRGKDGALGQRGRPGSGSD